MKPRVLFVSYTGERTGPTNSLILLLKYLREEFETAVLLPGRGLFADALNEMSVRMLRMPSLGRSRIPALARLLRREGFDLVYGNNTSGACRNAFIAARLTGIPYVAHVRGMGEGKGWGSFGYLRFADATVAVSEASARSITRFVKAERLRVIHNGVDVPKAAPDRSRSQGRLRRELGLPASALILANIAHLCPRKGQLNAVRAMNRIVRGHPTAHLVLIGALDRDPAYVRRVEEAIAELELDGHVSIVGFRRDVPEILEGTDVLLHTASVDPHPRAVIEAMARGVPVVGFAVGGVAETVEHERSGFLVPTKDVKGLAAAASALLGDPGLRSEQGARARTRCRERFSAARTARKVGDIIWETLEARAPEPQTRPFDMAVPT